MQCWQCGTEVQPGERTCGYCGARLTTPPASRSPRSSQQRNPSSRNAPRRPRDDDWDADALDESGYGSGYAPDDASHYGSAYGQDDRRGSRSRSDDSWDESRTGMRRGDQRSRPRGRQEPDERGGYPPDGYDQSGAYEDYASSEYGAQQPDPMDDPLNDPRAPRNLRSSPQRGPDSRSRQPSRDDWQQQAPPDMGDGRSHRPPTDPTRGRRDESGYYGQRQGQGYPPDPYDGYEEPGRSRRSQPSSADNRYSRSSVLRGQSYDEDYGSGSYGGGYSDEYDAQRQSGSRQDYGRRMPPDDDSSWYQQVGSRARSLQQRWGETLSSVRIPGFRAAEGEDKGKSSSRRIVTTVVVLLVLLTAVVAGAIVLAPRVLNRLNPPGATASSALCTASGPATNGTVPTPGAHLKQFASSRSRYGVNYPETWTVEPEQKAASGYDYIDVYTLPNSSTLVSIEQAQAACALTDVNIIQGEVAAAQQQNITFTESASAARTQTIGGEQWQRREYDVTDKGVTLHMVILACHHQGRAYVIVLVSRTTTFTQDDTGIFEPMLKSFTFTN